MSEQEMIILEFDNSINLNLNLNIKVHLMSLESSSLNINQLLCSQTILVWLLLTLSQNTFGFSKGRKF